jgi:hypothetical protein
MAIYRGAGVYLCVPWHISISVNRRGLKRANIREDQMIHSSREIFR